MKNKLFVIPLALCMLLVTSCDSSDSSSSASLTSDNVAYSEILSSKDTLVQNIKSAEYDNITINENFVLELPQSIGNPSVAVIDHFQDDYQKVYDKYVPKDIFKPECFQEVYMLMDKPTYPLGPGYEDVDGHLYVALGCTGFFNYNKCYMSGEALSNGVENPAEGPVRYSLSHDYEDASYTLGNKEMTVSQAVELAQKFSDEFCELTDYPTEIKAQYVDVLCAADKTYMRVTFTNYIDGVPVFDTYPRFSQLDNKYSVADKIDSYVTDGEVIEYGTNETFEVYEKGESVTILPPDKAVKLVSDYLAEEIDLDLKRVSLAYLLEKNGSLETVQEDEMTHRELTGGWCTFVSYDAFIARPVWVLYFDEERDKEIYALYDNLSGEIMFVNNKTGM